MLPYLTEQAPWFTFLVHPRDRTDLRNFGGSGLVDRYSTNGDEFQEKMCSLPPVVIGEVRFGFSKLRGEVIAAMRMPGQIMGPKGATAVREAFEVAARRGARVVGLGSLTSPRTRGGATLVDCATSASITVTNGSAYTAAVVRRNVDEAARFLGRDGVARVAVVGCTGSVGVAASHLLARAGYRLVLIGRTEARARKALDELRSKARFSGDVLAARSADIIVLLSSSRTALLTPEMVRPGAVVIDVCQPPNVPRSAYADFRRHGVAVAEGGYVRIPSYTSTYDFRAPEPSDTFACLAETCLFAKEGIREHSVGRPSFRLSERMDRIARRHGVELRPLGLSQAFGVERDVDVSLQAASRCR